MALKIAFWKAPSVTTLSNSMTYIALTGGLLAPLLTAAPVLPPAVEAKVAQPDSGVEVKVVRAQTVAVPSEPERIGAPAGPTAEPPRKDVTGGADLPQTALPALPPAQLIAEARTRLKTVRARNAPERKTDRTRKEQRGRPDAKVMKSEEGTAKSGSQDSKPAERESKAQVREAAPPPPTAVVPVQSTEPVNPVVPDAWSEAEVATALKECLRLLAPVEVEVEANTAMRKGDCGTPAPILLKSIGSNPKIMLQPAAEVNCPMALALSQWSKETLQPAAQDVFSSNVTRIVSVSGYSCRNRYGLAGERLSEHALANAIDIGGFALANGKVIKLATGWGETVRDRIAAAKAQREAEKEAKDKSAKGADSKTADGGKAKKQDDIPSPAIEPQERPTRASLKKGEGDERRKGTDAKKKKSGASADAIEISGAEASSSEGRFLRRLHKGACDAFGTVLGPEANEAHRDHFHFDLKARKRRSVCH